MEKYLDIQTLEGVRKRFVVRLASSAGEEVDATLYTFSGGAECAGDKRVDMEVVEVTAGKAVLDLLPLTPGPEKGWTNEREPWHYQLRATENASGGIFVVLEGTATVAEWRGATDADGTGTMLETVKADVVVDGEAVHVEVMLENALPVTPGPQGPQGEKGEKGDKGEPGESFTYEDLTEEQKADLVAPLVYTSVTCSPGGDTEDNYTGYGFGFVMPYAGRVTGLALECRGSGTATPAGVPIWVKVWRGATQVLAAVSEQAQEHAVGAVLSYSFATPFDVAEGEELRVSFHTEAGLAVTEYSMEEACCLRVLAKDAAAPGGLLGPAGAYGSETLKSWIPKHTWHMQVSRFELHCADEEVHLTATERAGLAELLARKDELLALLNS